MELSSQYTEAHLHFNFNCCCSPSIRHPRVGQGRVFFGFFDRPLTSRRTVHFECFPLKQSIQRYSIKYGLPHKTICHSRRNWHPSQKPLYDDLEHDRACKCCKCRTKRNFPRGMVLRSDFANTGSTGASYPEIQLNSKVRGILFYAVTACAAIVLFVPMLLQHPIVLLFDRYRRRTQFLIAKIWAFFTVTHFFKIEYKGLENLPSTDTPAVYVSNHQSFLDIFTLLTLGRSFKFISKTSIFLYPIIGWAMFLLGVIPLKRMDSRSQLECFKQCMALVNKGASVFFFPEGTRSKDGKLGAFKKGAFSVATRTGVPVVPITLIGTGEIMPRGMEGRLYHGSVKVIVHPPILGSSAEALCSEARNVIAQELASLV